RVFEVIEGHCTGRGMALLLVTHDLKAAARLCDRIAVLKDGRMVEAGDKLEVLGHPRHDYTRALAAAGRHRARTLMRTPIGGTLLDVRAVSRRYRQPDVSLFEPRPPVMALDGVSLAMRGGESVALVGPAGAGKSTLGRIVAGLERATAGELQFDGLVYHGTDLPWRIRRDITLVSADPAHAFDPRLSVGESVAEPMRLETQRPLGELSARLVEMVSAVGLSPDLLGRLPAEFSPGDLQRLAIARALTTRPRLIVLDEPVRRLDIAARGEIVVLLNRLRADFGLSFLLISHDLEVVRIVADRVLVMDRGRIVETGAPAQLFDKPQQPLTRQLVAAQLPDVGIVPVF
ncbi:MAG TPA: ATP-binding cassette domain-containing protein, partial [Devosia sp.]|nr:ATP-binding cassette domain-containing protein [Devosia sp.]